MAGHVKPPSHHELGTSARVSRATVRSQAKDLQQMAVSEDRAAELAIELSQIIGTVSAAPQTLGLAVDLISSIGLLNVQTVNNRRRLSQQNWLTPVLP